MEEQYWLRHPCLNGHQGPFKKKDMHAAIDADAFPRDSDVLLDAGDSEEMRDESHGWIPVTQLLGIDAAPPHFRASGPSRVFDPRLSRASPPIA